MKPEVAILQSNGQIGKSDSVSFSRLDNYHDKTPKDAYPSEIFQTLRTSTSYNQVDYYRHLEQNQRVSYCRNNFPIVYPACIISPEKRLIKFSGLIVIAIKAGFLRFPALSAQIKRDPYVYMAFANLLGDGLIVWLQADAVPASEEEYRAYFQVAQAYLVAKHELTQQELAVATANPTAFYFVGADREVWTNFFPSKLKLDTSQEQVKEGLSSLGVDLAKNETDRKLASQSTYRHEESNLTAKMLSGIQDELQRAMQESNETKANPLREQLMNRLLTQILPVDFRQLAKLDPEDETKLKLKDLMVLVAEQVLTIAQDNHWSLCRRYDFYYIYNGSVWQVIEPDELKRFLGQAAEQMGIDRLTARSFDFAQKLFYQFSHTAYLTAPTNDRSTIKVNLMNGTFEFGPQHQTLRDPNPADFLTHQLRFAYDPNAKAPLFEHFLNKVQPDKECQKLLAEYIGYVFVPSARLKMEKVMLLYGSGANGKSVFFEIIMGLLGSENVSNYSFEKLTTHPAYRAQIVNKLLNYASEINGNLESTVFKALASGEPVEARLLYGQPFTMTDYAKLIANTNELPAAPEHSNAYFRRFLIVPFNVTIPEHEQDKQLASKIIATELPGIFNWVLEGLGRLLKQNQFTDPEAVRNQLAQYRQQSDSVRLFLDEQAYKPNPDQYISLKDLYNEYKAYCQDDGFRHVKKLNFRKRLESYGIQTDDKNIGKVVYVAKQPQMD